jgi:ASC-1-like (ASCH) protein
MVYKHTRRRRKKVSTRIKRFGIKTQPKDTFVFFKENIKFWVPNLETYLRLDATLEKETLDLLDKNVKQGIISEDQKPLYLAFWRKIRELGQTYSDKTLQQVWNETLNEFVIRGLSKEKLQEIIDLVKDQLPRKKIFEQTQEWATVIDWLKFKALAFITPIKLFEREINRPVRPEFTHKIRPLSTRIIPLRPLQQITLLKFVTASLTRTFSLDLRNNIIIQFLTQVERFLTFTFTLQRLTFLVFDYDVIAPMFKRFILNVKPQVQFTFSIFTLATRIIELKNFLTLQTLTSVRPLPRRIINIVRPVNVKLITRVPIRKIQENTLTPIKQINTIMKSTVTNRNIQQIRPIQRIELRTSVRPA